MPATAEAARLNDLYHVAQGRVAARGAALVLTAQRELLDIRDLDRTFATYLATAQRLVMDQHAQAAQLGAEYYITHRRLSRVSGALDPVIIAPNGQQIASSLHYTGPTTAKRIMSRPGTFSSRLSLAEATAESVTAGSVWRLVANGARDTIMATATADPRVTRYARVTDGDPCPFCEMLAGRGAVYISEDTAAGSEYHDRCGCYPEAQYD